MKTFPFVFLALFFSFVGSAPAATQERISKRIYSEFTRLKALAETLEPEFEVGGLLKGKRYGDHELLWRLAEEPGQYDVIRIFRDKPGKDSFDVTFYRADHIVPGRMVIRRFVGPGVSGWRNDTMDLNTGEYLGAQGASRPRLDQRDLQILKKWDIELFE
jgi:hypothetical protein